MKSIRTLSTRRRERGFTLVEALVAFSLVVLILGGLYTLFEANTRITRVQTDISDMQQGQRIAQHDIARILQMGGRGGVPLGTLPNGLAVGVRNNVPEPTYILPGDASTPKILAGTDVLTVRGVFSSPIWQTPAEGNIAFVGGSPATGGSVVLNADTDSGIPQNLTALGEAICAGRREALMLVSNFSDQVFALVELDPSSSTAVPCDGTRLSGPVPTPMTVGFQISGGTYTVEYDALFPAGGFTPEFLGAKYVAILEEYRYYVREQRTPTNELVPTLTMARTYPGTTVAWNFANTGNANWGIALVDNIFDLQLALGVDTDNNGTIVDGELPGATLAMPVDEWLYNHPGDNDALPAWATGTFSYLRITTLVRSARRDFGYQGPLLTMIENHDYTSSPLNTGDERWFRRRALTTVVDVRNSG